MQINLSTLTWDQSIYPRAGKNQKTIESYLEALKIGAQFPPVTIQKVYNYPLDGAKREATLIIDGLHRFFAFKEDGRKQIPAVELNREPLDYGKSRVTLLLESANANIAHGDRLTSIDKKRIAREIAGSDPGCRILEFALSEKLGVAQQTVNTWISDIRARQKSDRNAVILRLNILGWTQAQIADVAKLSRSRVSEIVGNTNFGNFDTLLSRGHDMEYIANHYNIDLPLAWAMRLKGMIDQEKFKELGWGLRTWDQWYFSECDERFGDDWPGRIPAQLIAHALFYFSKPGQQVLDPMAGGGVVPDVCMIFERKCQAFDMAIHEKRPEIRYHYWDPDRMKWPEIKKPDLIFFDPPYFMKKAKEYEEKAGEGTIPVSSMKREKYLGFFKRFFRLAHKNTKASTRMAFINADWRVFESTPAMEEDPETAITIFDYHRLLIKSGWEVTHRAESPLPTERFTGGQVQRMQDRRILGTVGRTLLLARKA